MENINGIPPQHSNKTDITTINRRTMLNDHRFPEIYIEAIASQLRTSKKVIQYPALRSEKWTEACYEFLASLVKEDLGKALSREQRMRMGTSLSSKTLQKIMLREYKISYPIDPRRLNTLNKVVIFLGYDSWEDFRNKTDAAQGEEKREETPEEGIIEVIHTNVYSNGIPNPEKEVVEVIKAGIRNEYEAYCKLPEICDEKLLQTHIKDGPAFNLIMDMLMNKKEKLIISNPFNPSTCAVLDSRIKKLEADYALIYIKEYWLLCWWDTSASRYAQRYKNISDHFYILNKINGIWKIKTNASTADPMEGI